MKKVIGLKPCPKCGSLNINWFGRWVSICLKCSDCGFSVYPEDEAAPEEDYIEAWNKEADAVRLEI